MPPDPRWVRRNQYWLRLVGSVPRLWAHDGHGGGALGVAFFMVPEFRRYSGVSKMVERAILPPRAADALAWLDPSLTRQQVRERDRLRDAKSPPACGSEQEAGKSKTAESNVTRKSSPSAACKRRHGWIASILHVLLLATVGAVVFAALFCDSRLYYGIDVDGQPIHMEEQDDIEQMPTVDSYE